MQEKDESLMKELKKENHRYQLIKIECTLVFTQNSQIFIPTEIRQHGIVWYHRYLCLLGATRTKSTIHGTMMRPRLTKNLQSHYKTCKLCQFNKKTNTKYCKLPIKVAERAPWEIVQVDLVGPWKVKTSSGVKTIGAFT
jgi:hypothetical protein